MQGAAEQLVLHAVGKIGEAIDRENDLLDEKIKAIGKMDKDELEDLKERRLQQLQKKHQELQSLRQKGHGEYREISDTKDFFAQCKGSSRVIAAFYRPATWRCEVVDKHMQLLCRKHLETKFVRVDAEKNPFLCERLHIVMLPSIVLIKDGKTDHTIIGFDEFGGDDDFSTETMEYVLQQRGMVDGDVDPPDSPTTMMRKKQQQVRPSLRQEHDDDDDDYDWS